MTTTSVIASILFCITVFNILAMPFLFGEERKPYSPQSWLVDLVIQFPLLYVLYHVIFGV